MPTSRQSTANTNTAIALSGMLCRSIASSLGVVEPAGIEGVASSSSVIGWWPDDVIVDVIAGIFNV